MPSSIAAIDVAVLVPERVAGPARDISRALSGGRPDALQLDDTHLPHVTLAQQFVERARLDELFGELDRILRHEPVLLLRIPGVAVDHGTISLAVDRTADLQHLHELVMDAIEPFESPDLGRGPQRGVPAAGTAVELRRGSPSTSLRTGRGGAPGRVPGADAFRPNGEAIRPQDVDWVRNYREHSAYAHYRPHVTLGHGDMSPAVQPIDFRADRIAVCELGRFCTCRAVLGVWTLGGTRL